MFGTSRKARTEGVKTEFVYADGAKDDVQLSGDWNDWKAIQMFHEGGGMWSVVTPVPPGAHEFKYIVDGEWKHSSRHPTIGIDDISLNNVRYVLQQPDIGPRAPGTAKAAGVPGAAGSRGARTPSGRAASLSGGLRTPRDSFSRDSRTSRAKKSVASLFGGGR